MIDIARGFLGIFVMLLLCYLLSNDRKAINWRLVIIGVSSQLILAVAVLKIPLLNQAFDTVAGFFRKVLEFTEEGAIFMFGNIVTDMNTFGYIFAFQVLPTIIFFSALTSILYYFGILQFIIKGAAWAMAKSMGLSLSLIHI